jgi:hypothetical protein
VQRLHQIARKFVRSVDAQKLRLATRLRALAARDELADPAAEEAAAARLLLELSASAPDVSRPPAVAQEVLGAVAALAEHQRTRLLRVVIDAWGWTPSPAEAERLLRLVVPAQHQRSADYAKDAGRETVQLLIESLGPPRAGGMGLGRSPDSVFTDAVRSGNVHVMRYLLTGLPLPGSGWAAVEARAAVWQAYTLARQLGATEIERLLDQYFTRVDVSWRGGWGMGGSSSFDYW